jgi:protein-tyrosine phosphatase/predicted kinase
MEWNIKKGCLVLQGEIINEIANRYQKEQCKNREKRDGKDYHITVIKSNELKKNKIIIENLVRPTNYINLGKGEVYDKNKNWTKFLVFKIPYAQELRRQYGLEWKDFHITLSFNNYDIHDVSKNEDTLLKMNEFPNEKELYKIIFSDQNDQKLISWYFLNEGKNPKILELINKNNKFISSISSLLYENQYLAGAYWKIYLKYQKMNFTNTKEIYKFYINLINGVENDKYKHLNIDYGKKLVNFINRIVKFVIEYKPLEMRDYEISNGRYSFYNYSFQLNFRKIRKNLYVSGRPNTNTPENFLAMKILGIENILTVDEKPLKWNGSPLLVEHFKFFNKFFIYNEDYKTPGFNNIEQSIKFIENSIENNKKILVHCGVGKGRSMTIIIAYLMWKENKGYNEIRSGLDENDPIRLSEEQIETLKKWYNQMFFMSLNDVVVLKVNFPRTIILVGLPGSGKSSFSKLIQNQYPNKNNIIRINKDEMREKMEMDNTINNKINNKNITFIIDNCNLEVSTRNYWINYFSKKRIWIIYFKMDIEECENRIKNRTDHPTLKSSQYSIVKNMYEKLEEPNYYTEKVEKIIEINSIEESYELLKKWGFTPNYPKNNLLKFPRTPHFIDLGGTTRDDLVISEKNVNEFYKSPEVLIEEKIDGANLGISLIDNEIKIQNRSHYINNKSHSQFQLINNWISKKYDSLMKILNENRIIYGEWVFAKHSIYYDKLPDLFIVFDIYDRLEERFFSRNRLEKTLADTDLFWVPLIFKGRLKNVNLYNLIEEYSEFSSNYRREGIYLRLNTPKWLIKRAKIVRSDFIEGDERWDIKDIEKNKLISYE